MSSSSPAARFRRSVTVFLDNRPVRQYHHNGKTFIPVDLTQKGSYIQTADQYTVQDWCVLPFQIEVRICEGSPNCWVYLRLDGARAGREFIRPGQSKTFRGFLNTSTGRVTEFLFSLPRYARGKNDRIASERVNAIGTIQVEVIEAIFERTVVCFPDDLKYNFVQANKKDCEQRTNRPFTMATAKEGQELREFACGPATRQHRDVYKFGKMLSFQTIHYGFHDVLRSVGVPLELEGTSSA